MTAFGAHAPTASGRAATALVASPAAAPASEIPSPPTVAEPAAAPVTVARPRRRRRRALISPLTRRVLTVNVLPLGAFVAGLLYLGQYQDSLIQAELAALRTQAEIFAGALGQAAVGIGEDGSQELLPDLARSMVRRLVEPTNTRARLFASDGALVADSRSLVGPGGRIAVEVLPPPSDSGQLWGLVLESYDSIVRWLPSRRDLPAYVEKPEQHAVDYEEAVEAFAGDTATAVRVRAGNVLILSVAAPVQRFKQVHGVLLLTETGFGIDLAVRQVRFDILRISAIALALTIGLSLYLAGTIARPVRRLAAAAERVRRGRGRNRTIPDFTHRGDEIGDLSSSLRAMTDALGQRMEAIQSFAADVAHELKNPLSSLRSAVETAARMTDLGQQRRLMQVILDDVQRLDRLITDISDASRLDAELARARMERVDLAKLLQALVEIHVDTAKPEDPKLSLELAAESGLAINGLEGRLVEVFENLISNAFSFSPPGGRVVITAGREGEWIVVAVADDGPGIPEKNIETIFERFYTERPAGERFGQHSGLGLSISRQIVEAHGGTITATNRKDESGRVRGAAFTGRLPAE